MDAIQMQEILLQLQAQQVTIEQLQNQLAQQPPPTPPQVAAAPPATIAFPDPGKFDGKNIWTYPQWRQKAAAKIRADWQRIGDDQQQAWYIFSQLESPAADRASPWMQQNRATISALRLFEYLDAYYRDPTYQDKACQKLFSVQQKNQPLPAFLTYFDQLLLEAGGAEWAEQTKISLLRKSVSTDLLIFLVSRTTPGTYDELKMALRDIDNNAYLIRNTKTSPSQLFEQPRQALVPSSAEPMDLDHISTTKKQRAKWVAHDEIQQRRAENRCLRCGALQHRIKTCPYLPARRPGHETVNINDEEPLKE